ncbi:MAG: hypothetical protein KAI79_08795 [Bacteroidales bacterium]|nr:hypothetical protein [Bacteroidales bacterium]
MQTINFDEVSSELVYLNENSSSILLDIKLPANYKLDRHLDFPTIKSADKELAVIQNIQREKRFLYFKIKINGQIGRTELKFNGKAIVEKEKIKFLANFNIIIPILISNNGEDSFECNANLL